MSLALMVLIYRLEKIENLNNKCVFIQYLNYN